MFYKPYFESFVGSWICLLLSAFYPFSTELITHTLCGGLYFLWPFFQGFPRSTTLLLKKPQVAAAQLRSFK